jgi:hypothetical protein
MIHADSRATNLVDQKMTYVGISRGKTSVVVYTDDRAKLVPGIMEGAGGGMWLWRMERKHSKLQRVLVRL